MQRDEEKTFKSYGKGQKMNIINIVENFLLNPQNLHFLLAILMLMPFTLFVILTSFFSWIKGKDHQEEPIRKMPPDYKNLEDELKRELDSYQKKRAEIEEEKRKKALEAEEKRKKREETIKQSESMLENIKDFAFHENSGEYAALFALILDLISRDVPATKIAQILKSRFAFMSEDEPLETVAAFEDFIAQLHNEQENSEEKSRKILKSVANGDVSQALAFLHDKAQKITKIADTEAQPTLKSTLYDQVAQLACIYSIFAHFEDDALAYKPLSLALKFSPSNVVAWNLLGNFYLRELKEKEAFDAFENVLQYEAETPFQSANAHKFLSLKSYKEGDFSSALKHFQIAHNFYETVKINHKLSAEDAQALDIILFRQNVSALVDKLMAKQGGY